MYSRSLGVRMFYLCRINCVQTIFPLLGNNSVSKQEQMDRTPVLTLATAAATHVVCEALESASNVDFGFKLHFSHAYAPKLF